MNNYRLIAFSATAWKGALLPYCLNRFVGIISLDIAIICEVCVHVLHHHFTCLLSFLNMVEVNNMILNFVIILQ